MVQTSGTEWHNTDKRQYKLSDSKNSKHNNRPKKIPIGNFIGNN